MMMLHYSFVKLTQPKIQVESSFEADITIFYTFLMCTLLSIICFKLAEITNSNELENSKYGQKTGKM